MALRRRAGAQYDVLVSPSDDQAAVGEEVAKALKKKGFCTIKTTGLGQLIDEARPEIKEMSAAGRFQPTPAIVIEGLLGEEGSIRTAELAQESELCAALARLDQHLTQLGTAIGSAEALQSLGIQISGRTPGLLHEAGLLSWDPPEVAQDSVVKWLNTFIWHRVMLLLCLGPGKGTLELTPFDEEGQVHRVLTEAGMVVALRADVLWHRHSVPGAGTHVLSTFLQTCGRASGQGLTAEHPAIPVAEKLDAWAMKRLELAVEDPDAFDALDSRWKYALEHVYHKEQQFAVRGAGMKIASTWNTEAFCHTMNAGLDVVTEVPYARWDHRMYYSEDPEGWKYFKVNVNHTAMCDGMDLFDAKFFRISPAETKGMDPMQRQIMEVGYVALATAGRTAKNLLQSLTAVYVGCHLTEWPMVDQGPEEAGGCEQRSAGTGQAGSIMSNRFSFVFGMNGPSVQFDTDASSGLAALETGTVALDERKTNATMSMCMGIAVTLTPLTWIHRVGLGQMCPVGRCLSFDQSACGWVKGEGGVAFAVDNLTEKVEGVSIIDESRYYLGTVGTVKINHAGMQTNLGTPHGPAVQQLVAEACRQAHVSPCSLDYVECMADAQSMNDAVEVASIGRVACSEPRIPLGLESMKANWGNSIQGSSLGSMLKVLYCQAYGWQQPSNHLAAINPQISDFMDSEMFITQEVLLNSTRSSVAAVQSIGWGGTMGCGICSCGPDPDRVAPAQPCYPYQAMTFWPGGGGEELPEPEDGYYISGSWTGFEAPQRMAREAPGLWTFELTLGVNRFEEFQIHFDGDANLALHPGVAAGANGSAAHGPNTEAEGLNWLVDGRVRLAVLEDAEDAGGAALARLPGRMVESTAGIGDRYLVSLSIAGKWRAVSWERVGGAEAAALEAMLADPAVEGRYFLTSPSGDWAMQEMAAGEAKGHYAREVRILSTRHELLVVRNQDWRQMFWPERQGEAGAAGPGEAWDGGSWRLEGKAGDVFLVEFHRALEGGRDLKRLESRFLRHEAPTPEELLMARRR